MPSIEQKAYRVGATYGAKIVGNKPLLDDKTLNKWNQEMTDYIVNPATSKEDADKVNNAYQNGFRKYSEEKKD